MTDYFLLYKSAKDVHDSVNNSVSHVKLINQKLL